MAIEAFSLDGLALEASPFQIADTPVFTPAPLRLDWVGGVDTDGSVPLDAGHSDNATLTLPMRVKQQSTANLAWQQLATLLKKLEATRLIKTGLELLWTPKDATDTWELRVLSGEIPELSMASRGDAIGYLSRSPRFTVVLTCAPFLYRDNESIEFTEVTSTEPVFSISLASVPGHVDAEATITVTDNATQGRRHVEWGLGKGTAGSLLIDSASLVISGFLGTSTTRTGAYSSSGVIRASLATQPQAVCGTGNLAHVGTFRPKARIYATDSAIRVRFAYRTADGPYTYLPWITPPVTDDFCEVAFGVMTIAEVQAGAQQWDGRIEAYSTSANEQVDIDYIEVLPAERWGKARGRYLYRPGLLVARDEFNLPISSTLNAQVAPLGGTWATTGATGDFTAISGPGTGNVSMRRATTSDGSYRTAVLGATAYANTEVGVDFYLSGGVTAANVAVHGIYARWVDASNHLALLHTTGVLTLQAIVLGSAVMAAAIYVPDALETWFSLRLVVYTSGIAIATLLSGSGAIIDEITFQHSSLATGGALDDGKPGMFDLNSGTTALSRYFDNFYAATPFAEQYAINSGRAILFRHDSTERLSSDGLTYGKPDSYTGSRAFVPCAGNENRTTRLWAKARRLDIDVAADSSIADSTKVDVSLRPRYRMPIGP